MKLLTTEQQKELVGMIIEEYGTELSFDEFADAVLGLCEDIAGFETATQSITRKLTQLLWSQYHEQTRSSSRAQENRP